ncbi:MAG: disulfide bond formation protein B [Candidatus Peregrinibacteria bacterium]|nr:disulfide bond formation protein B [Candidatus Peregrinibacteria bacterium]MCB9808764.1 disulfide bond formation protein B [Candidatus Peribacteria bacterium]
MLAHHSTLLAFIVAVVATASSLTYSEVFGMRPCELCVYQRIVIFPQVIVLGIALWRQHHDIVTDYALSLALVAMPISLFHYILQKTDAPAIHAFAPCDFTGQAPSCSNYYVNMYGYVTIPLMALTTSALILLLMVLRKRMH